jgi:hypothetical protein
MSIVRRVKRNKRMWLLMGVGAGAALTGFWIYHRHRALVSELSASAGAYCDNGIGAAKRLAVMR